MSHSKGYYITTTLPYVNAAPHVGFALELVQADSLARYYRLVGKDVFFNSGTDEHGQKIAQKADEAGQDRQAYVDHFAGEFNKLKEALNLSYDNFVRTTNPDHKKAAQELWRRCEARGDIYKKKYKGLYCVGDEMFLRESDLVDGRCPHHPNLDPIEIEEENYFFRLSNYQEYLQEYLSQPGVIVPEWRREEALQFVAGGLEDFSISREKKRMDWGVPVPDDDEQVMYVWFDALTNYISTLGWPDETSFLYKTFWEEGETLQLAGKDQIRFQSIMWQAMLKSAGIPSTDRVLYHGFVTSGGKKMSKSLGNVISPYDLIESYGTDSTRYVLLRHMHPFDDSDITLEKMDEWYEANLVNGLGNMVARIMKMAETHVTEPANLKPAPLPEEYKEAFEAFEIQKASDIVWKHIGEVDAYIQETQPFKIVKTDKQKAQEIICELVKRLEQIAVMLLPLLPNAAHEIQEAIRNNKMPSALFPRKE